MKGLSIIFDSDELMNMDMINMMLSKVGQKSKEELYLEKNNLQHNYNSIYCLYPYLFRKSFREKKYENEKLNQIAVAGMLYSEYIIFLDLLEDEQRNLELCEFKQIMFSSHESIKILSFLFGKNSEFWKHFDRYNKEYQMALLLEKDQNEKKLFNQETYLKIAKGKSAIAKCSAAAIASLVGQEDIIEQIEEMQDFYAIAFQLFDDLRDVKEDIEKGILSSVVSKIITDNRIQDDYEYNKIMQIFFEQNYDEYFTYVINSYCEKAMFKCEANNDNWLRHCRLLQIRIEKLRNDLLKLRTSKINSYIFKEDLNSNHECSVQDEIEFLLIQAKMGFPESMFFMMFPNEQGFSCKEVCQKGNVFQRAFILNILYELGDLGFQINIEEINNIAKETIREKAKHYTNAWSFFPDFPELYPDIDTFSEIYRLSRYCMLNEDNGFLQLIDKILEKCLNEDGSFCTWISDLSINKENEEKASLCARNLWGEESDKEVVCNFLYTLYITNNELYKERIKEGITWLLKQDTNYVSTWYVGEGYYQYVYSRFLTKLDYKYDNWVKELLDNLISDLNCEIDNINDMAFKVIAAIKCAKKCNIDIKNIVQKIIKKILRLRTKEAYWHGENFIKMNLERVTGGSNYVFYKSATVTSVICLLAHALGSKYLNNEY